MPYDLEQFAQELRRRDEKFEQDFRNAESTRTVQMEELRAELSRTRRTANRGARRAERIAQCIKDFPGMIKIIQDMSVTINDLKSMSTALDRVASRLSYFIILYLLANLATPVLATDTGKAMLEFMLKKVMH